MCVNGTASSSANAAKQTPLIATLLQTCCRYFELSAGEKKALGVLVFARLWRFMRLGFGTKMALKANSKARVF